MHFPLDPVLSGSFAGSSASLWPLKFAVLQDCHLTSSLSSDSIPLKYLNVESFQIYISSSALSSELQTHTSNYLLNISNWRPVRFLKLKSKLPCHLPHFTAILSLLAVQTKNLEIILDSCFFSYPLPNPL